jgi:hypothetical protein
VADPKHRRAAAHELRLLHQIAAGHEGVLDAARRQARAGDLVQPAAIDAGPADDETPF